MHPVNDLAAHHYFWVEQMGWHNKSNMESLALISCGISKAVDEAPDDVLSLKFPEKLVNIVLRLFDLAQMHGINLDARISRLVAPGEGGSSPTSQLAQVLVSVGRAMDSCRSEPPCAPFGEHLAKSVLQVFALAPACGIDLHDAVVRKMLENSTKSKPTYECKVLV